MERRERGRKIVRWMIFNGMVQNQRDLALQMGYHPTVVSAALTGKIPFSDKLSRNLCKMCQRLNLSWLLTGEGEMILPESEAPAAAAPAVSTAPFYPHLPATAGVADQYDYVADSVGMPLSSVHVEAFFPVSGHSMEPYLYDGDIVGVVSVDSLERVNPDKVYMVVTRSGGRMVKHIVLTPDDPDHITLVSDNPTFLPSKVRRDEVLRLMRVVCSVRLYR
ncbi:MAG: S24 family peptidase [Bacteroidales bacterium]|nr:S24 family peptidase [Candidatus Physcousia equi]